MTTAPELYPDLVRLNVVGSLVGLLLHENTDIADDVVDFVKELTGNLFKVFFGGRGGGGILLMLLPRNPS